MGALWDRDVLRRGLERNLAGRAMSFHHPVAHEAVERGRTSPDGFFSKKSDADQARPTARPARGCDSLRRTTLTRAKNQADAAAR